MAASCFHYFLDCNPLKKIFWQIKIVSFDSEHPNWDHNLWFTPLSETVIGFILSPCKRVIPFSFIFFSRKSEDTAEEANALFLNCHAEVVYQAIQSVFFGALAMSTLRFKFLWTPHMCLFAAGVFCNQSFWKAVLNKIGIKQIYVSIDLQVSLNIVKSGRVQKVIVS